MRGPGFSASTALRGALAALGLLLALPGCGFQPLHADRSATGAGAAGLGDVAVAPIAERTGQLLRFELEDRFRRAPVSGGPGYVLRVELRESSVGTAVDVDESVTRANQQLAADYVLLDGDVELYTGSAGATSSYNILRSDYGTIVAERDARQRNVTRLADFIERDLAVLFLRAERDPSLFERKPATEGALRR